MLVSDLMPSTEALGRSRWDAIVVGAGPAGSMAARELAMRGASVLLVDRHRFPREKVCGGCLNGQALAMLRSAGLDGLAERSGGTRLTSFRLGVAGRTLELELPAGMAVPRDRFDAALAAAAVAAGARLLPGTYAGIGPVAGATRMVRLGTGRDRRVVAANLVLAATGLAGSRLPAGSAPRSWVARDSRIGAGCVMDAAPPRFDAGAIHMAVGRDGYVGLVRLADGRLHVAAAMRAASLQDGGGPGRAAAAVLAEAGLPELPGLETAAWRGTPGMTRGLRPPADERLLILGDAAGYVEPFTGEGIAWALASARAIGPLAARAVRAWEPGIARDWIAIHGRVVRRRQIICHAAAEILRRPWCTRAAFHLIARSPLVVARLLERLNNPPPLVEVS